MTYTFPLTITMFETFILSTRIDYSKTYNNNSQITMTILIRYLDNIIFFYITLIIPTSFCQIVYIDFIK